MARPKSEDKREAILLAATHIFATRGLAAAPTSAISKAAGIAEGTLFTYFPTKVGLSNALYRSIKVEVAHALMTGFPSSEPVRTRLQFIWDRYVRWGLAHPEQRLALQQLQVSGTLTPESLAAGEAPFTPIVAMAQEAIRTGIIHPLPLDFIASTMSALVESTIQLLASKPGSNATRIRKLGFELLWRGLAKEP
jgi:AcrR family transcriptional regulator